MNSWITMNMLEDAQYKEITDAEVTEALTDGIRQIGNCLNAFGNAFPYACSVNRFYEPGPNRNWTAGFYTGEVWLAYENADLAGPFSKDFFKVKAEAQVRSFLQRINDKNDVDHHDMGFLYSPSCVAAYKLTGSREGRQAALLAADQLITRFQPVGKFIQAWGRMGEADNYRFIIDCLLNLPLLYWASEESKDSKYRDIAEQHIHTAMANVIREDDSTWHTVYMDMNTGKFSHGATCQGYKDGSAWARGQAWGVYGTAVAYKYTHQKEYLSYFKRVTNYFLQHLPSDLRPFWDLSFGNGMEEQEPRDTSSAAIAACGMLEMSKYLRENGEEDEAVRYTGYAKKLLKALYDHDRVTDPHMSNGVLLHGTYSKKSPYNTCTPEGVDECVIWGDYYWMEALNRLHNPSWNIYW